MDLELHQLSLGEMLNIRYVQLEREGWLSVGTGALRDLDPGECSKTRHIFVAQHPRCSPHCQQRD
jgi:hypothetical protein